MHDNTSTLDVEGFTPYAQIPRWVVRSHGALSGNAVHLYGVLMSYADNGTRAAFPKRTTLAEDMGRSVDTVKRAMRELEDFGALKVVRRRSKTTGLNIANLYTLVFSDPRCTDAPQMGAPVHHELDSTPPTPTPSSLRSHHRPGDDDSSLRSHHAQRDAPTLKDLAHTMYLDGCEDPDEFIEAFEKEHPGAVTDLGHLILNCWGPEGTTDRIDREISRARGNGRRDPVRYGIGTWVRKLPGITHGTLRGA